MADWSHPVLADSYSSILTTYLTGRDVDVATMFFATPSNQPTHSIRYNRSTNLFEEWSGSAWQTKVISLAGGGTGVSDATSARSALGLGTMATQNSSGVAITGGTIMGVSIDASTILAGEVPLSRGGTGSSLTLAASGRMLQSDGVNVVFGVDGSSLKNLNASEITSGALTFSILGVPTVALKSANYTLTNSDDIVLCTGTLTISLQAVSGAKKKFYYIKNYAAATNVTVTRAGIDTIEGATSFTLYPTEAITIYPNGSNWYLL